MSALAAAVIDGLGPGDNRPRHRRQRYVAACLLANLMIWSIALAYLTLAPARYTVNWSLIIPSSDSDARISLNEVGQAYNAPRSAYDARSLDPRVNYREIALSQPVLAAAAGIAGIDVDDFPLPRVKLIDQSSVMEFQITATSPTNALRMAEALNAAVRDRLDELRHDESTRREQGVEAAIQSARAKLEAARKSVVDFKISSQIVSADQLSRIGNARIELENRRRSLAEQVARSEEWTDATGRWLGVTAPRAAHAMVVQSDSLFMEHYRHYVEASTLLTEYQYKFGDRHPRVITETKRRDRMFEAMTRRAVELHGETMDAAEVRNLMVLLSEKDRETMFPDFVRNSADLRSLKAELETVNQHLATMASDQAGLARNFATLEELERRLMFAEAIFNSTLGKTDVGRADIYASYPLVQDLVPPGLPRRPSSPIAALAFLGALASSLFATIGLTLSWMRDKHAFATAYA